uniref:Uncharacterized protein n=1 Tax=Quercus lobata TaxID=97700 RepID=A0A7N2LHZ2_QUELO
MATEETKDPFKGVDWKAVGGDMQKDPGAKPVIKKRLPKKIRQIPECYFLPRRSLPSAIAFYGSCIAGGIGAGMLLEIWIKKKVKGHNNLFSAFLAVDTHLLKTCKMRMEVSYGSLTSRAWIALPESLSRSSLMICIPRL